MSREWDAAFAAIDVARASDRLWTAACEVRVAKLKQAAELERQGRIDEARTIIDAVRAELETVSA